MAEHTEAWYRGYNEYFDEKRRSDDPFPVYTQDSVEWNEGFGAAQMEVELSPYKEI